MHYYIMKAYFNRNKKWFSYFSNASKWGMVGSIILTVVCYAFILFLASEGIYGIGTFLLCIGTVAGVILSAIIWNAENDRTINEQLDGYLDNLAYLKKLIEGSPYNINSEVKISHLIEIYEGYLTENGKKKTSSHAIIKSILGIVTFAWAIISSFSGILFDDIRIAGVAIILFLLTLLSIIVIKINDNDINPSRYGRMVELLSDIIIVYYS